MRPVLGPVLTLLTLLTLSSCGVGTVVNVVTAPVRVAGKAIDRATTIECECRGGGAGAHVTMCGDPLELGARRRPHHELPGQVAARHGMAPFAAAAVVALPGPLGRSSRNQPTARWPAANTSI